MRPVHFLARAILITLVSSCAKKQAEVPAAASAPDADTAAMAPSMSPPQESLPGGNKGAAPGPAEPVQTPMQDQAPKSGDSSERP
jgi:hypothetical protein